MPTTLNAHTGIYSNLDYTSGNTPGEAIQAACTAAATGGNGTVMLAPDASGYAVTGDTWLTVPKGVTLDLNGQTITWTSNTANDETYGVRVMPGAYLKNGDIVCAGTGTGAPLAFIGVSIPLNGAEREDPENVPGVFLRELKTRVRDVGLYGQTTRLRRGIYFLADGDYTYVQAVTLTNIKLYDFGKPFEMEARNGTDVCFVNGVSMSDVWIERCSDAPTMNGTGEANVNANHFADIKIQASPITQKVWTFIGASTNIFSKVQLYDWDESSQTVGITADGGSNGNRMNVRSSSALIGDFFGGADARTNTFEIDGRTPKGWPGAVTVTSNAGVKTWNCRADGSGFDDRATIVEAMTYAIANMPAHVHFGPGKYGVSGGMILEPTQGDSGLTVESGGDAEFVFTGGVPLTGGQEIMFKIRPSVTPGDTAYDDYLSDIVFRRLRCSDDDPAAHDGTDQSHFVDVQYCKNVLVENCVMDSVGDEAINFLHVVSGTIRGCYTINTPSFGTDGAPISIQQGCRDITIEGNTLYGSSTPGTASTIARSAGISVASLTAAGIENVRIEGNTIRDFERAGVFLNPSSGNLDDIKIQNNFINGADYGLRRVGGSNSLTNLTFTYNTLSDILLEGFSSGVAGVSDDHNVSRNTFDGCPVALQMPVAVRLRFNDNLLKACERGAIVTTSTDSEFNLNRFEGCGGAGIEEIETTNGTGNTANQNISKNSACTNGIIRNVQNCHGNELRRASVSAANGGFGIESCVNASGNILVNAGIRPAASATDGLISNNKITCSFTGGTSSGRYAIDIAAANTNYTITGNNVDMTGCANNQLALRLNGNDCVVTGNTFIAATDAYADNATGTLPGAAVGPDNIDILNQVNRIT
ncbi:MAG: right-handed parallel beta-helix repeat-containing protein [Gammaproteobacteria bacterium]